VAISVVGFIAGPVLLPFKVLPVWGSSMEPTIHLGAAVVLEEVPADRIRVGDVITFRRTDRATEFVTHRVVRIEVQPDGRTYFVTKGDANGAPDPWRVPAVGTGLRERFSVPYLGRAYGWLHRPNGRLGLFAVIVAGIGALLTAARGGITGRSVGDLPGPVDFVIVGLLGLYVPWLAWLGLRLHRER
jgi:signal peptidase